MTRTTRPDAGSGEAIPASNDLLLDDFYCDAQKPPSVGPRRLTAGTEQVRRHRRAAGSRAEHPGRFCWRTRRPKSRPPRQPARRRPRRVGQRLAGDLEVRPPRWVRSKPRSSNTDRVRISVPVPTKRGQRPSCEDPIGLVAWRFVSLPNALRVVRRYRPSGFGFTGGRSCRSLPVRITTSASRCCSRSSSRPSS